MLFDILALQWLVPSVLLLLPLIVLSWLPAKQQKTIVWAKFIPIDPWSSSLALLFKLLASLALACLIMALAEPYLPEQQRERIGKGADVVVLVDRSRSMDDAFAIKGQLLMASVGKADSKRRVAKQYLQQFIDNRPDDRFGFVLFSDKALDLLPLSYNRDTIRATVNASVLGKGLSETNIAQALIKAAEMYDSEIYRGARIVVLVSDGGQQFSEAAQQQIATLYQQQKLTLYWLYMRSVTGMTLDAKPGDNVLWTDTPERKLHTFFNSLAIPYRAFEIETMKSFSEAIATIDKQQYQPLLVSETLPRQQLTDARQQALALEERVNSVVLGQQQAIRLILIALYARGHVLLAGGVGVGKTTLLRAFARSLGGALGWVDGAGKPIIEPGPLLAQGEDTAVFFFNEINRARPQVQSLLLRAMAERSVQAFGKQYNFPHMLVFADRNAVEKEETFELSAAARDRFLFEIEINHPPALTDRKSLIFDTRFHDVDQLLAELAEPLLDHTILNALDTAIQQAIFVSPEMEDYIVKIWDATWHPAKFGIMIADVVINDLVVAGASVRGMSAMVRAAKVSAWLADRDYLLPDDVHRVLLASLSHRVFLTPIYEVHREQIMPLFIKVLRDQIAAP